jgi:type IV secretory pathway VirB10-like protein
MSGDVLGGGVVVVIAAALWLAYLLPTWLRRREYLATELNAVRLQQTLRILAETSELPDEVRVEANARTVAEHQRILRKAEAREKVNTRAAAKAEVRAAEEAQARAAAQAQARAAADAAARAAAEAQVRASDIVVRAPLATPRPAPRSLSRSSRLRRARAATSLVLLGSLVTAGFGIPALVATGSGLLLGGAAVPAVGAFIVLGRLARAGRRQITAPVVSHAPVAAAFYDDAEHSAPAAAVQATWTPQPLPKPLYLARGTIAASAMASVDAAAELRRAAARADLALRAAQIETDVTPLRARPAAAPAPERSVAGSARSAGPSSVTVDRAGAAQSRFASMGVVSDVEARAIDLDAALRRRRAAS